MFLIDVVSPASHDSRLCQIFSPVAGAGSCSYVDSSTMDSRGFPDMPDISISPDSSLSEDISRPFPTFSPMVADFSSCIDSCPFQPFLDLHARVSESRVYNFQGLCLPVPSSLRLAVYLRDYEDYAICDFLEFGWPVGFDYSSSFPKTSDFRHHKGAIDFPDAVDSYLLSETVRNAVTGPFSHNPFSCPVAVSPLNSVPKSDTTERRIILDLSWPVGSSVNDGIQSGS